MKRQIEVFKFVLEFVELHGDGISWQSPVEESWDDEICDFRTFGYHCQLCLDEGLIVGKFIGTIGTMEFSRLTNTGHDYLALMKSDTVWEKTKEQVAKLGGWSVEVLGQILKKVAMDQLGL